MRIFFAAQIGGPVMDRINAAYIRQIRDAIKENEIKAEWRPELIGNFHVTLRFVGEVAYDAEIERLHDLVKDVANSHPPLILTLGGKGVFGPSHIHGNERVSKTYWVGVGGQLGTLCDLAGGVDQAVEEAGYGPSVYDYRPHLTIGRATCERWQDAQTLDQAWTETPDPAGHGYPYLVHEIGMYESRRMPNGTTMYVRVSQRMPLNPTLLKVD